MEDMKIGEIFNKFYGELAAKSKVPDTGNFSVTILIYINRWEMVGQYSTPNN